ncbi:M1 family metallopeptidase [Paraflavisolibacter sp. H34]|uniref:M1 family metallopeptidase n=1 Tax=Huijunlia imazamoxiresistens TaxID=3127457 RepID=UPI00301A8E0A
MKYPLSLFSLFFSLSLWAQGGYWQQKVKYTMTIDMDVAANRYAGRQKLEYWNQSPDTLDRVFYHLYWNAFQPNSMMDERSRRQGTVVFRKDLQGNPIGDWDPRVEDRIRQLKPEERGYETIASLKMDGRPQKWTLHETILEVKLDKPMAPGAKATFDMEWQAQVPLQVRRSGRDNPYTDVRYTMTQWYPKLCEYDKDGWHPTPYVGREFYGVWGDFDVTINIDPTYVVGGTGNLQNAAAVGFGYEEKGVKVAAPAGKKRSWHFVAPNVHDFAWAADPQYKHITRTIPGGPVIHVLYKAKPSSYAFESLSAETRSTYSNDFAAYVKSWDEQWERVADAAVTVLPFIEKTFGKYPYKQYSFIHGGDGGMEYPNCTMIASPSLGTAFHEWMHSWYQGMLATNESLYAWMDEGFTEWATDRVEAYYQQQLRKASGTASVARHKADSVEAQPSVMHAGIYGSYFRLAASGREEPLTTHADHFNTNYAYTNAAYSKGGVFLEQLGYITGAATLDRMLLEYYRRWRFKHPDVADFFRIAEKESGMKLDWYREYWVNTTKTIDYAIDSLWEAGGLTRVRLRDKGLMPMPIEVRVTFKDGSSEWHYIPLDLMFGRKPAEQGQQPRTEYEAWRWTNAVYEIQTKKRLADISAVEIDPSQRMADVDKKNNKLELKW